MLFSRSTSLWIALAAPFFLNLCVQSTAFAGDDFDDLPDEDLEDEDPPEGRPSAPASGGDGFDFGEDPEWDDAPAPVPVPKGLDEDPEEGRGKAAPKDDFLEEDPLEDRATGRSPSQGLDDDEPSDVFRAAPRKDTFLDDEDPVEIVRPPTSAPIDDLPAAPKTAPARAPAPVVVAAPASGIGVETKGKRALSDNFPAVVVGRDLDAVVVELPILVANKPTDHKADYWLIVDVMIADRKVGEQRYWVAENTIAEMGPTLVWCKAHVPVSGRTGKVRLKVSKVVGSADPSELFVQTVEYAL